MDGTLQYFAKLGELKNFENSRGRLAKLGGSKIARGYEPLFMQNKKYLDAYFEKSVHFYIRITSKLYLIVKFMYY